MKLARRQLIKAAGSLDQLTGVAPPPILGCAPATLAYTPDSSLPDCRD